VEQAREHRRMHGKPTVLFVDEVHRFNKSQQDAFLPHVEDGTIAFVGATTENPSFELNNALLSRVRTYVLKGLTEADIRAIIDAALTDAERGLGSGTCAWPTGCAIAWPRPPTAMPGARSTCWRSPRPGGRGRGERRSPRRPWMK
jgi:replication-associated recombination protein RarA